jgi:hypothetical protein
VASAIAVIEAASLGVGANGFSTIVGVRYATRLRSPPASLEFFMAMRQLHRVEKSRE